MIDDKLKFNSHKLDAIKKAKQVNGKIIYLKRL